MEKENHELDFCLLIPCYDNKDGLIDSLSSVNYNPGRFLVVVVDDGSVEPLRTEEIKKTLPISFPLVILRLEENKGITRALNTGLAWIQQHCDAKYIARLDCGDTCDPQRFYIQVHAMNSRPEAGLSGSWCVFEDKGKRLRFEYKTPLSHEKICRAMHFRNIFIHPTVIFQRKLITEVGFYPVEFEYAEDYAYFWKILQITQTFVLNQFLVTCEINTTGISYKNRCKQLAARQNVIRIFAKKKFFKLAAILKLRVLFIIPKRLLLLLKTFRG